MCFFSLEFRGFFFAAKNRQVLRSAASKVEESFGLSGLAPGLEGRRGAFGRGLEMTYVLAMKMVCELAFGRKWPEADFLFCVLGML